MLDDVVARRFWLGQLTPEEQGRIEELAFEDHETFMFLASAENDLIDEFIQGELSADEEQQFDDYFLSLPGRRKNLEISQMLQQHFNRVRPVPAFSWVQIVMTAATVLALVIFAVWLINRFFQSRQSAPIEAGHDRPAPIPSPSFSVSPSLEPTSSPAHVENKPKSLSPEKQRILPPYALLSPSASSRSEGVQPLLLTPDAPTMTIELALITPKDFSTYEAVLENESGTVLQRWSNLKAERLTSGKALKIDVPVALFKPQEFYRLVVSGISSKEETEEIARYPFEVKTK